MSARLDLLVPQLEMYATEFVRQLGLAGLQPRVTSTLRSSAEQKRLYSRFLSGAAQYPVAVPGTSAHEYGEAFDMIVAPMDALEEVGPIWRSWGGGWAGLHDPVHFELPGASAYYKSHAPSSPTSEISPKTHSLAIAADFVIGLNPYIGSLELAATLIGFGFPENQVLQFLSGPFEYLAK